MDIPTNPNPAGEDGHTDESQSHKKKHLTRFSKQKAGLDNDDQKQEGEKGGSEKEDMRLPNGELAANRMLSQDKIPEPKGSVKEEEDGGRESICQHQATLLSLPYEIRKMIWELVLSRHEESPIPRRGKSGLPGLRYRHSQRPRFWSAMTLKEMKKDVFSGVEGWRRREDWDWREKFLRFDEVIPVKNHDFFKLVMTSKTTVPEVVQNFHEATHWIFENRLNLHLFLDAIAGHGCYLRSISLCLQKSQAPYSNDVKDKYKSWKLGNSSPGPSLKVTIDKLQESCPNLEYLELRPGSVT